jgi:hypothetical protein
MRLPEIKMDADEADERASRYEDLDPRRMTEEDRATARGYRALADGLMLIDLTLAMREAGLGEDLRPRLAIARADVAAVRFSPSWRGGGVFEPSVAGRQRAPSKFIAMPPGTFPPLPDGISTWAIRGAVAHTPAIPPEHRPAPSALKDHHVLWEAVWEPAPPDDPFLLRHLAGSLYVVLAQWDLTPLEQAVMRGRIMEGPR